MRLLCALALIIPLLAGCVQVREFEFGQPIAASDEPDPAAGLDIAAVLKQLGPPLRISATPGGYVMAWEYWRIRELKIGLDLGLAGLDFLSIDIGRAHTSGDFLLLSFGRDRRLRAGSFMEWDGGAGGGQGVQAFASIVDVVEVEDLLAPLPAHHWGFNSLERLPVSLNRRSRLDDGQGGLQQRGTPRGAGQAALESP